MGNNFTQLYVHCVWATWNRMPLITPEIKHHLYNAIAHKCEAINCCLIAIGGIHDHIHILTRFPPSLSIAKLVKDIKGNSAHFINHQIKPPQVFKWQANYGAFTVNRPGIPAVANYIKNQEKHHREKSLITELELVEELDF